MTSPIVPTVGSVLSLIPAIGGAVQFTANGSTWTLPLVGYPVVVGAVTVDESGLIAYSSEVDAIVLAPPAPSSGITSGTPHLAAPGASDLTYRLRAGRAALWVREQVGSPTADSCS